MMDLLPATRALMRRAINMNTRARCSQRLNTSTRTQTCRQISSAIQYNKDRSICLPHRPQWQSLSTTTPSTMRFNSSLAIPENESGQQSTQPEVKEPSYKLTFTCKPCSARSSHLVTKHGYHKGTVLISCPDCKARHIISDHLGIFMDQASTLEDILQRTAGTDQDISKLLKKGQLGMRSGQMIGNETEQDLEFWDDGTTTKYQPPGPNLYDIQKENAIKGQKDGLPS